MTWHMSCLRADGQDPHHRSLEIRLSYCPAKPERTWRFPWEVSSSGSTLVWHLTSTVRWIFRSPGSRDVLSECSLDSMLLSTCLPSSISSVGGDLSFSRSLFEKTTCRQGAMQVSRKPLMCPSKKTGGSAYLPLRDPMQSGTPKSRRSQVLQVRGITRGRGGGA